MKKAESKKEKKLYETINRAIKKYLTENNHNEKAFHEVSETLSCLTALNLALYSSLFVKKNAMSHIDYITNKINELAFESYIDDVKKGCIYKGKKIPKNKIKQCEPF